MDEENTRAALSSIDWNFSSSSTLPTSVHSLHWFPGNFIPQLPTFLIQALSAPLDMVADPYCGSGTTGIQAALIGRNAWQSDNNRVSALITRAKTILLTDISVRSALSRIADPLGWTLTPQHDDAGVHGEGAAPELANWFHPGTLSQLRCIWKTIEGFCEPNIEVVLRMLFSDILFSCASAGGAMTSGGGKRKQHWGWIADNVVPRRVVWHDAQRLFQTALSRTLEVVRATPLITATELRFCNADAKQLPMEADTADLIVTSPPYLGMIDYANANRLTYLWFGWKLAVDRANEIGARARRNNRSEPDQYLVSLRQSAEEIRRVLRHGRYCAIVLGASRKYPTIAETSLGIIGEVLQPFWGPVARVPSRRRVAERGGTQPSEFVCVFRNMK